MIKKLKILLIIFIFIPLSAYSAPKEIDWDDLIPWTSVFSPGEVKFNKNLEDKEVKIPGYVLPLDVYGRGINTFLLVPYIGACIHVPPPAPNQIVYVEAENPRILRFYINDLIRRWWRDMDACSNVWN